MVSISNRDLGFSTFAASALLVCPLSEFFICFAHLCASHIENYPLIEMYLVESCEKGEFPYAKEKNHLHERCTSLLPIRF